MFSRVVCLSFVWNFIVCGCECVCVCVSRVPNDTVSYSMTDILLFEDGVYV